MTDLPICTTDIRQEVKIRLGTTGLSAVEPRTCMENFDAIVEKCGDKPALFQKVVKEEISVEETPWTSWTWKEYRNQCNKFAKALLSLGLAEFDVVNIIGFNSPEWFFANFGAIAAKTVPAGIYATNNPEACKYISLDSKAKVVVCDGVKQLLKYIEIHKDLPDLMALVMYGKEPLPDDFATRCSVPVYRWEAFLRLGGRVDDALLNSRSQSWKPGETCTLIYTSGTTGSPKAVMITNDNITWTCRALLQTSRKGYMDDTDVMISYLPLSHIAAQILDLHIPMATGTQIYFAQPDALKGSLKDTLLDVRPTTFFGVPRVWEKFYEALQTFAKSSTGMTKVISTWAKEQSSSYWSSMENHNRRGYSMLCSTVPMTYNFAKMVLVAAHKKLGFDRCYAFYVSAAPIEPKILRYFASIDIPIMELFGQSECCGPHAVNTYDAFKIGTVGRPMPGTETRIDEATGELCYRGRHIFAGYMGMPDKTQEAIDDDGWLHSGDVATIDKDDNPEIPSPSGFVTITGRIKELIITAGGENIPPVLIENELKAAIPALSNAMVVGDKRKFLVSLLCLQVEVDSEGLPTNKLAGTALETSKEIGSTAVTTDEAKADPLWQEYLEKGVKAANEKATSRAQRIAKWSLLPTDFSEKGTELTPTLKLKRSVAAAKYSYIIEELYAEN